MVLAFLGARVIKVERPGTGDAGRNMSEDPDAPDSYYFMLLNLGKESLAVDLKDEEGREAFLDLAEDADALVENFSLGVMDRLGIDYETLAEVNPELVYASIKGFGTYGPWKDHKAFDATAQATGGSTGLTGYPDRPPVRPSAFVGDTGAGLMTAIGVMGALMQREHTGRGQRVEVSQQDAVAFFTRPRLAHTVKTGRPVERRGNEVPGRPLSGLYPCDPGGPNDYVSLYIASEQPAMWESLFETIGREGAMDGPFGDAEHRRENQGRIHDWIEEWTEERTKYEAMEALAGAGLPCGAVLDTAEVLENEQLIERDMIVPLDHPVRGQFRAVGCPIKLSGSEPHVAPPPLLGADTFDVLEEAGYSPEEVADLIDRGVVEARGEP